MTRQIYTCRQREECVRRMRAEQEAGWRVVGLGLLLVWPINQKGTQYECGRGLRLDSQRTRITKGAVRQWDEEQQQELRLRDDPWCIICYLNHVTSCCCFHEGSPGWGLLGTRQRNHPTGFNLCVFECFWLRIANSNKTQLWLNFRFLSLLLLCCCFVVVLFSCGKLSLGPERTSISHFPASPCCCFLLVVLVVVVQLQPHYNTFALCASQLNLRLLWAVEGGRGRASISVTACACWH